MAYRVEQRPMVQPLIPVPRPARGRMSPGRAALSAHTPAAAERAGGRGTRPETPAGAMGSAIAADDRSNTLTCVSLALFGPSSPGSPKLCGHQGVRAVAGLRLCDIHAQQARP